MTRTAPSIRVLPTPESEPPYEEEMALPVRSQLRGSTLGVQETLALTFPLPSGAPATPDGPAALRRVPPGEDGASNVPGERGAAPTNARPWAGKFVQAFVEALAGARPVTQLLHWTSPEVYDTVRRRASVPGGWPADAAAPRRSRVLSVRLCNPWSASLRYARSSAVAGAPTRWRCASKRPTGGGAVRNSNSGEVVYGRVAGAFGRRALGRTHAPPPAARAAARPYTRRLDARFSPSWEASGSYADHWLPNLRAISRG